MKSKYVFVIAAGFAAFGLHAQVGQAGGESSSNFHSTMTRGAVEAKAARALRHHNADAMIGQQFGETPSHFKSTLTRKQVRAQTAAALKSGQIPEPDESGL